VGEVVARVNDLGYIVAGYVLTAVVLAGYLAVLLARARRARLRAQAVAARQGRGPRPLATTEP
jgi:hypothetical protein